MQLGERALVEASFSKMIVIFMSVFSRMMNLTDENISEIWQFDGKSRERDGQKVGLKFIGFKAGRKEEIREWCLLVDTSKAQW